MLVPVDREQREILKDPERRGDRPWSPSEVRAELAWNPGGNALPQSSRQGLLAYIFAACRASLWGRGEGLARQRPGLGRPGWLVAGAVHQMQAPRRGRVGGSEEGVLRSGSWPHGLDRIRGVLLNNEMKTNSLPLFRLMNPKPSEPEEP